MAKHKAERTHTPQEEQPSYQAQPRVAVIIPAKDEADRIEATVTAARQIPYVDLVVVVDDGSSDGTANAARAAGAKVVVHKRNYGKAAAMQSGASAVNTYETRFEQGRKPEDPRRALLFIDADLGETALACAPLVEPVVAGKADFTIAYLPPQEGAGGFGFVTGLGHKVIQQLTGWSCQQPLSGQRCLSRAAYEAALPFAPGWGVEVGMSIDLLVAGYTVQEVACELKHRATGNDLRGYVHRADQYKDVLRAALVRRMRGVRVPPEKRVLAASGEPYGGATGEPFNAWRAIS